MVGEWIRKRHILGAECDGQCEIAFGDLMVKVKSIIIINDFAYVNGGASQVALSSAIGLASHGYHVILFAAVGPAMEELQMAGVQVELVNQYEIAKDPNRLRAVFQGLWNHSAQQMVKKLLAGLDAESTVVHLHGWTKALSSSVIQAVIHSGFKVVCTLHDYFIACPNGGFFDYQSQQICRKPRISLSCLGSNCDVRNYPQKIWRVIRHIIQSNFGCIPEGIKHFICISDFSCGILSPFLPIGTHVHRINNPINIEKSEKVDVSLNSDVIFIGRLSEEKGVVKFATVANRMEISPIFVGDGESRDRILSVCPRARITGWVSKQEIMGYLSNARVLVLPSLWYETQGLVVAEAAAMGVPAIVSDSCAARDMVIDEVTGLWCEMQSEFDLDRKIQFLLSNSSFAAELGRNAYDKYWMDPSVMSMHLKSLLNLYHSILESQ